MYYTATYSCPVGTLTLACDEAGKHLVGLWMEGQTYHGGTLADAMTPRADLPIFHTTKTWLDRYFAGERPDSAQLPLAPVGGDFRQGVWAVLREIPYGTVTTYGDIAKKMAARLHRKSMSSQAVGGAVGHNPLAILIPCHRVVGTNGSLTGYAGGIAAKWKLLELEGADLSRLLLPKQGTAL